MVKTTLVAVADGTEELEAVAVIDCLRRAGCQVTVASVQALQISTSRNIKITADCLICDCLKQDYDLIALPGGMPGAEHLSACRELVELLKKQNADGRYYAAICASPAVVLERHGLLKGKKATCYPSMSGQIKDGKYVDSPVVVDGNCITSQGAGTAVEFALKLVELLYGAEKSKTLRTAMVIEES